MSAPLTPLIPSAIAARKRPLAIVHVYLVELLWAMLVATPVHAWARRVWGAHPEGDAALFAPGGRALLTWLGQEDSALGVVSRTSIVLTVLGALVMQLALGALVVSLAFSREDSAAAHATAAGGPRAPRWASALRASVSAFLPLAGLLVVGSVVIALVLGLGGVAAAAAAHALTDRLGDAHAFTFQVVTFACFGLVAAIIGVVVDLARAAIGREAGLASANGDVVPAWSSLVRGIGTAFSVARRRLGPACVAWAWRALLAIGLVIVGAFASQALGGKGGLALLGLWLFHQAVVLGRVALRASWLARALRFVAPVQDARDAARHATSPLVAPEAPAAMAPLPTGGDCTRFSLVPPRRTRSGVTTR